ncbi:unnamed protein product [Phyllotreta striolata]|uniref:CRAL-TRIO domain-containing protein n=1 Tax=Phyllotreta striolata TaxID=444603 RepID=A0A9N9TPJ1_PHYSR|nr:unnamed protein product [Phyllotreta striolata]
MDTNLDRLLIIHREKLLESLGKTENEINEDVNIILEWFKTQKHLPEPLSRHAIARWLVLTKFSIERTKQLCDMYYTSRSLFRDVYDCCDIEQPEQKLCIEKVFYYIPLPKQTRDFYRVDVVAFQDFEYENYNPYRMLAQVHMIYELAMHKDFEAGDIVIIDFKHIRKSYVLKTTPTSLKVLNIFLEKIWASRVKGIHFINVPTYAETLIKIARTILKKKLLNRLYVHSNIENLYEYLPREILPKDFGGDEKSLAELNELWKSELEKNSERLKHLQKLTVNNSLRTEPLINSDYLGYYGNFKKLDVD